MKKENFFWKTFVTLSYPAQDGEEKPFLWWKEGLRALLSFLIILFVFQMYNLFFVPPKDFPEGEVVSIEKQEKVDQIAQKLEKKHFIKSAKAFKALLILTGFDSKIVAGDYLFKKPESMIKLAKRLAIRDLGI